MKSSSSAVEKSGSRLEVDPRRLSAGEGLCCRYRLEDPGLLASIRRLGILVPLLVTCGPRPCVISGHKRLAAARNLKLKQIPVLVAPEMKIKEAFLMGLVSNWKQIYSETDRAKALGLAAKVFGFTQQELLSVVMPLVGLPEDQATLELYLKVDLLGAELKDLVEEGYLPLRGLAFLLKFTRSDQTFFAKNIATRVKLTSSQLLQSGEWLADMIKRTGKGLEALCRQNKLLSGLAVAGMDSRIKADRFFARVKKLRFPGASRYLKGFEAKRNSLSRDLKGWRLEPVQGFEEPGFELHARVKTPEEMEALLRRFSENQAALNSLFEIML